MINALRGVVMAKTIIVGAGINGLLLGALLSHEGDEVLVFEKNSTVGGRASLLERDGFLFDYGVHLTRFGPVSAVASIMRYIGREVQYREMGRSFVIDFDGRMKLFPTSPGGIFKSELFSLKEKFRILGLLLKIKGGAYNDQMDVSLQDWMLENGITGGIKKYFELLSASVMVCPFIERTSAGEMFRNINRVLKSGHSAEYPVGGWKPIHDALIAEIEKNGKILTSKKVDRVIVNKGVAAGVLVARKRHLADRIVMNMPVQEIFSVVSERNFDRSYVSLCKGLIPTSGVFVDIALKRKISGIDGLLYTASPITYGIITSNICEAVAPEGKQLLTVFYPTSLEDITGLKNVKRKKEDLWKSVKRYFPDIERDILWKREVALRMVDGVQVNVNQTADRRPGTVVPGIGGLYLVGDSVAAPGAGGDVGNESVLIAFREITGKAI
jgi:phytoene dehydrogenase-like protein